MNINYILRRIAHKSRLSLLKTNPNSTVSKNLSGQIRYTLFSMPTALLSITNEYGE